MFSSLICHFVLDTESSMFLKELVFHFRGNGVWIPASAGMTKIRNFFLKKKVCEFIAHLFNVDIN